MSGERPGGDAGEEWIRGKSCVVTGTTSGIGFETARGLALRGAHVLLVARDATRLETAAELIRREAGDRSVETVPVRDLAEQSNVRALAEELLHRAPSIHVLVNNAGAIFTRRELTGDGIERTFALNVVAPYLLSTLLAPSLERGAPARIVMIASAAHWRARRGDEDWQAERRYSGFEQYSRSKLAVLLLTHELARRLRSRGIVVNAVHPGFVASHFGQNTPGAFATGMAILERLFGISPRRGARTPIYVASSPEAGRATGTYFVRCRPHSSSRASNDDAVASRLLAALASLTHVQPLGAPGFGPA
jgi:NAD(P)-dependent dehydrogenase (short-subunit alcohol dehydrogenase family)